MDWAALAELAVMVGWLWAAKIDYDLNERWGWTWDSEMYWHRRVKHEMRCDRQGGYYR